MADSSSYSNKLLNGTGLVTVLTTLKSWLTSNYFSKSSILSVANGGTGLSSIESNFVPVGNGTDTLSLYSLTSNAFASASDLIATQQAVYNALPSLNGAKISSAYSFYAPTNAGTAGAILTWESSNGVPAWATSTAIGVGYARYLSLPSSLRGTYSTPVYFDSAGLATPFASTIGTATRGVYLSGGAITSLSYYLSATVGIGSTSRLAFYSNATSLASYTSTVGGSMQAMYLSNGIPTAGFKVLYGSSLPSAFDSSLYPAGTIFIVTS